jgi:hypothetical protein
MIVLTDEATKQLCSYGLHERTADAVLTYLYLLYLKELPPDAKMKHFYSDRGREILQLSN